MVIVGVLSVVFTLMAGETWLSARNERRLRHRGAIEPTDDVFPAMRMAYPLAFVLMAIEGLVRAPAGTAWLIAGTAVFSLAKLLKYVAIATLGDRWSFRVLVVRDRPLVTSGIYAYVRHPNYLAIIGELVGASMLLHAPVAGTAAAFGVGLLLKKRIDVEERALAASSGVSSPDLPTSSLPTAPRSGTS